MRTTRTATSPTTLDKTKALAAYTWYTTAEAGRIAGGVEAETVRGWIGDGKLAALNISPGKRRPEYRIAPEALDRFITQYLKVA